MVQLCKKKCLEISFRETLTSQSVQKSSMVTEVEVDASAEKLKAISEG